MKGTMNIKSRLLTALVCLSALASGVSAQQDGMSSQIPSSTKGAVIKGKAPVNKDLLKVKLPKAQEADLKNGLHVVVIESNHRLPIFSVQMIVMSYGLSDPADMHGWANDTAILVREGTDKHKSRELSEQFD